MTSRLLTVTLVGVLLVGAVGAGAREPVVADSPEEIKPLVVGDTIPDATLTTWDHLPFALRDSLAQAPTVLIYYRGGW